MSEAERQCRINHIDYQTVKHDDEQAIMTDIKADGTYLSYNNVTGGYYETTGFKRVKNEDGSFTDYYILRIIWGELRQNDKETDIIYLSAKNKV